MIYKNRPLIYILITMCFLSSAGCAALQRKFVRKKKKEEKVSPITTTLDYSKGLRVDELYKKHFLFWRSWQSELIQRMDATYKKRIECYDFTISSLLEMQKYLKEEKARELDPFIEELKTIDPDIRKKRLSKSETYRMTQLLEHTMRRIDKEFSYSNVEDFLELRK